MSSYLDIGPGYGGNATINLCDSFKTDAMALTQAWWSEANIDTRVEAGDPYAFSSVPGFNYNYENVISINLTRPIINMISGRQRQYRNSTIVVPVENGDQQTADQFSKLLLWLNKGGVLETMSDCFQGALITGMNLGQVWVDYRDDPVSGDIKFDKCDYNTFIIDPYFRKDDLSDCRGILKRSFLTREEVASLVPTFKDEVVSLYGNQSRDGKFPYMPENLTNGNRNLLTYDEFYYRAYREKTSLATPDGETQEWTGKDENLDEYLSFFPEVKVTKSIVPTVNLALIVQGNLVYDGRNPLGIDRYPFIPFFAYYRPENSDICNRLQGVVRGLRDVQFMYNRRRSNENDILESQINSGTIVKENALVNFDDVFKKGTGQIMVLKHTAQMSDIFFKDAPTIPPSTFQAAENMKTDFSQISGVNEELLGSSADDLAGIVSKLRQEAGLVTLQPLFDKFNRSQYLVGTLMLEVIQKNFTPGKVKRIINEEPSQEFYHKAFGKYDAVVQQGVNTDTQKQMAFAQMLHLREKNIPIPDESLIEAMTIQDKDKIIELMQKEKAEAAQMQQMQMQSQLELNSAQVESYQAKAKADLGWAFERTSRVPENRMLAVTHYAEAEEAHQQAILNMAKTLSELDDSKLAQMEKMIQLSAMLSAEGAPKDIKTIAPTQLEQAMRKQASRDNQDQTKNENKLGQPAAAGV